MKRNVFYKPLLEVEKLGLLKLSAEEAFKHFKKEKMTHGFNKPAFDRDIVYIVEGTAGKIECCGDTMDDWWRYCPNCGDALHIEEVFEVYHSKKEANKSEYAKELKIRESIRYFVYETIQSPVNGDAA